MTVITGVASGVAGQPAAGRTVTARLVASSPLLTSGGQVIVPASTITGADGAWALTGLIPSSAYVDTGAYLEIDDGHGAPYVVLVPDSGTHEVGTVLITPPPPSGLLSASAEALLALVAQVQAAGDGGYKATWAAGTAYRAGDTVQHSASVYGALKPSTGVTPGTDPATWKIYPSSGGGGGAVSSVFGRDGDVAAQAGDYALADITGLAAALDGKQAVDADLTAIAALTPANDDLLQRKAGAWTSRTPAQVKTDLALVKADVGLSNVDNTSDAAKQVSTATQTALNAKADLVGGVVPTAQIPAIAVIDYLGAVASQAAMLALSGQKGDWATRTDLGTTWVITGTDPTQLASWTALSYPAAPVTSVNTQLGVVVLGAADVGAAPTSHGHAAADVTSGTFTIARIPTGTTGSTVPFGNDARFTDTRTPTDNTVTTAKLVDGNVTLAKLASIGAATLLGNNTGGSAAPIALTAAQAKTLLAIAQADVSGLTAALAALAPLASPALTGTATAVNLTLSGRQLNTPVALTPGSSVAVDASLGNEFTLTAAQNFTLANPSSAVNGQKILFVIRQDGTGSRVMTLGNKFRFGTDITAAVLSTAAGKTDLLGVRYHGPDDKFDVVVFIKGY